MEFSRLYTVNEAAALVKVKPSTISAWFSRGKLARVKVGGRTLVRAEALEAMIQETTGLIR